MTRCDLVTPEFGEAYFVPNENGKWHVESYPKTKTYRDLCREMASKLDTSTCECEIEGTVLCIMSDGSIVNG